MVNIKKGQFLAPSDMQHVIAKALSAGNPNVMACERGVSFGYNTLVNDMRALPILAEIGCPVVFDATHSVAQPGGGGDKSSGERRVFFFLYYPGTGAVRPRRSGVAAVFMVCVPTRIRTGRRPSDGPVTCRGSKDFGAFML